MRAYCLLVAFVCLPALAYAQPGPPIHLRGIDNLLYADPSDVENDSLQRLNLVLPSHPTNPPLLIWIGGGAWSYGDRHVEMDLARALAREGIAVASVGHRLSPAIWRDPALNEGVQHPAHIEDVARAFRWLHDNAANYGFDKGRMFVGGYSSGGHLAALLSLNERYLRVQGLSTANIRGVIPIAGVYDISDYHRVFLASDNSSMAELHVEAVFGPTESDFLGASPTTYIDQLSVPMLLISENNTYNYTRRFEDKIAATSFRALDVVHVLSMGHGELWRHLSSDQDSRYRRLIAGFIKR